MQLNMRLLLNNHHPARLLLLILLLAGLVACSTLSGAPANREGSPEPPAAAAGEAAGFYWWRARFVTPLAADEEPRWVSDLMVADLVIEPVIQEYVSSLALWRFHRRAVHDDGGHIFSFIFYADRPSAEQVFAAIDQSPALARLLKHGLIGSYDNDLAAENQNSAPGATSDPNWSKPLREVWPAYIMGASVTWLGLINQHIDATGAVDRDFSELVADYEKVDAALGEMWHKEGQHAFLHHLNALFGYEPMRLQIETNF
jgi:hypothetical protein